MSTTGVRLRISRPFALLVLSLATTGASAAEVVYELEPEHTFPSFEADHMGVSTWRGKFNASRGEVRLDRERGTGSVEVVVDARSIDFGLDALNEWAIGKDLLDTDRYPEATYRGNLVGFRDGASTRVEGELTLRGVTRPLTLAIDRFHCQPHPIFKRDWCGADAHATFDRSEFGLDAGKDHGFDMDVTLRIQVEANIKAEEAATS
ncbi:YceI family protein [Luteimonas sp. R10]|uniref:YceI family protein n=1 Tax=Luteimonas sp. R10 TaxID=3108176 RepID=UPI00308C9882|nr:YceI family protein [Luteimonas sp. R10]